VQHDLTHDGNPKVWDEHHQTCNNLCHTTDKPGIGTASGTAIRHKRFKQKLVEDSGGGGTHVPHPQGSNQGRKPHNFPQL
jgi:hypothetical protein